MPTESEEGGSEKSEEAPLASKSDAPPAKTESLADVPKPGERRFVSISEGSPAHPKVKQYMKQAWDSADPNLIDPNQLASHRANFSHDELRTKFGESLNNPNIELPPALKVVTHGQLNEFVRQLGSVVSPQTTFKPEVKWDFSIDPQNLQVEAKFWLQPKEDSNPSLGGEMTFFTDGSETWEIADPYLLGPARPQGLTKAEDDPMESDTLVSSRSSSEDGLAAIEIAEVVEYADDGGDAEEATNLSKPDGKEATSKGATSFVPENESSVSRGNETSAFRKMRGAVWNKLKEARRDATVLQRGGKYACVSRKVVSNYIEGEKNAKTGAKSEESQAPQHDLLASVTDADDATKVDWKKEIKDALVDLTPEDVEGDVRKALAELLESEDIERSDVQALKGDEAEKFIYELTRLSALYVLNMINLSNPPPILKKLYNRKADDVGGAKLYAMLTEAVDAVLKNYFARGDRSEKRPKAEPVTKSSKSTRAVATSAVARGLNRIKPVEQKLQVIFRGRIVNILTNAAREHSGAKSPTVNLFKFAQSVINAKDEADFSKHASALEAKMFAALCHDHLVRMNFNKLKVTMRAAVDAASAKSFSPNVDDAFVEAFPKSLQNEIPDLNDAERKELRNHMRNGFIPDGGGKVGEVARKVRNYKEETEANVYLYWSTFDFARTRLLEG